MYRSIFFLDNPNHPSLAPHLYFLGLTGLWHPTPSKYAKFKQGLFYIAITFFLSQYVKCLIKFDSESVKLILQYASFHMGIIKTCLFQKDYNLWEELIDFVADTESHQLANKDKTKCEVIHSYIHRNRRVTYFFWLMAVFANISIFTEPYKQNQVVENGTSTYLHIIDGYTPFDDTPTGYYITMAIETVLGNLMTTYVIIWDTLTVSLMIFFAGQLKIVRYQCIHMIDVKNIKNSHKNIAEIHHFYVSLIKLLTLYNVNVTYLRYQKLLNRLTSKVMFVYLIVICVNLAVCIMQIVETQDDLRALVYSIEYIVACLIQLLLFYWHSNEVIIESSLVSYSIFESDWVGIDQTLRKEVCLLGLTTTKRFTFDAGPFKEMSLATVVGILRTSYSFYTLMHGTN